MNEPNKKGAGDTDNRFSATMRIEISPEELRRETVKDFGSRPSIRRRPSKRIRTVPKTKSGNLADERHAVVKNPNIQQLFQSVYDAAIITDPYGDIIDANKRAEDFFNSKRSDFVTLNVLDIISGADESLIKTLRKNLESDRFTLIEAYCKRFDGSLFPAEISVNRLQFSGHDYLCFFVRDITIRRQTEERVRTVHKAIHNAGNGIAITDVEGFLEYINPATVRLWKYPGEAEMMECRIHDLWSEDADFKGMITQVQEDKPWVGTLKAQRYDGTVIPLQVSATANHDADDQLAGMVFSFVDVRDRIRAEEMAREAERQRIMLESIGSACHHLGQPATVLLTSLGIMQKRESSIDEEMRKLLRQGIESAEKLRTILHRLNHINEYRTVQYLDDPTKEASCNGDRIVQL